MRAADVKGKAKAAAKMPRGLPPPILQRVQGKTMRLVGTIAEFFPAEMQALAPKFLKHVIKVLNAEFKSKSPKLQLIAGGLRGLTSFLSSFPVMIEDNQKANEAIYAFVAKAVVIPEGLVRYEIPRAGCDLLARHGQLFATQLLADADKVFQRLFVLCRYDNKDVKVRPCDVLCLIGGGSWIGLISFASARTDTTMARRDPQTGKRAIALTTAHAHAHAHGC